MKTRIIVNPMANKGNCGKRWPQIRAELEKYLGPLDSNDIAITRARNLATALAKEAVSAGYRRLISVGGDGTFSEMMNGVISDDRPIAPGLVLAQLPGGTSNELSRSVSSRSASPPEGGGRSAIAHIPHRPGVPNRRKSEMTIQRKAISL